MKPKIDDHDVLEEIWHQVPPDYYQNGIANNQLQRKWHTGKLKAVIELIGNDPSSILDVGSASGWFLDRVHRYFPKCHCVGVDIYEPAIKHAKKQYPSLTFKLGDAHKLPFKNSSFDVVICTEVLEHVIDPLAVVKEIERVLVPGGRAIIEMDSGNFLFRAAWYWWTNMRKGVWRDSHIHIFNSSILENLLMKSELTLIKKKYFNFSMGVVFALEKRT
ncbi:MAG: class I SAM-dependent methyltransferase [Candidatus Levybacteria bacterium]|nr:class I SAM-dependent methyltransferase [Candidatus Levybacteria bacterium]